MVRKGSSVRVRQRALRFRLLRAILVSGVDVRDGCATSTSRPRAQGEAWFGRGLPAVDGVCARVDPFRFPSTRSVTPSERRQPIATPTGHCTGLASTRMSRRGCAAASTSPANRPCGSRPTREQGTERNWTEQRRRLDRGQGSRGLGRPPGRTIQTVNSPAARSSRVTRRPRSGESRNTTSPVLARIPLTSPRGWTRTTAMAGCRSSLAKKNTHYPS
jgi:hypothetical protein